MFAMAALFSFPIAFPFIGWKLLKIIILNTQPVNTKNLSPLKRYQNVRLLTRNNENDFYY